MNKDEYEKYVTTLFEIKKYLLERLIEYKNCINKETINHLTFKLLILRLLDKINEVEILEEEKKMPEKIDNSYYHLKQDEQNQLFKNKINDIIVYLDYLKSKGE